MMVVLRPQGTGTITSRAQVTGSEYDTDPTDNLAAETTTVK
ncbi:hypothetical protein Q2K19_05785 [Micromonospora soli]|nr:hypothetical protein [Micromonospora sp. NBRC 110009]WKU00001.1 hypothetical protein Q2K19_05785 [Micromonospora sp. NBRC 110009]